MVTWFSSLWNFDLELARGHGPLDCEANLATYC